MLAIDSIVFFLHNARRCAELGPELQIEDASLTTGELRKRTHFSTGTLLMKARELVAAGVAQLVELSGPGYHWRLTEDFVTQVKAAADAAVVKIIEAGGKPVCIDKLRAHIQERGYNLIDYTTMSGVVAELIWRTTRLPIIGPSKDRCFTANVTEWLKCVALRAQREEKA